MANEIDGLHLVVDGRVWNPEKVFAQKRLRAMMLRLVKDLGMELIWGPRFKVVELDPAKLTGDEFQDEGGLSGFCMIGTSHISVHVWPLRQHFSLDVYSCKHFDEALAKRTIVEFLEPEQANFVTIRRRQGGEPDELGGLAQTYERMFSGEGAPAAQA